MNMDLRWKNNLVLWNRMYESNVVVSLADLSVPLDGRIVVKLTETPSPLRELRGRIEYFWGAFVQEHPTAYNSSVLATTGIDALSTDSREGILNAFVADYATCIFKNTLIQQENPQLSDAQRQFLQQHFLVVGASGYTSIGDEYVLGRRTDRGPTDRLAGLIQYLPQGLAIVEGNCQNAIERTMALELKEETSLDLDADCGHIFPTHVLVGRLNGDFTIIHKIQLKPDSKEKIAADKTEVEEIMYRTMPEIKRQLAQENERHLFSPVTASVFQTLSNE